VFTSSRRAWTGLQGPHRYCAITPGGKLALSGSAKSNRVNRRSFSAPKTTVTVLSQIDPTLSATAETDASQCSYRTGPRSCRAGMHSYPAGTGRSPGDNSKHRADKPAARRVARLHTPAGRRRWPDGLRAWPALRQTSAVGPHALPAVMRRPAEPRRRARGPWRSPAGPHRWFVGPHRWPGAQPLSDNPLGLVPTGQSPETGRSSVRRR
jgi:hypothetical protein